MLLQPGTTLQRGYVIEKTLGRGGMGAVYLARQANLGGRRVAIKETAIHGISAEERTMAVDLFRQEAAILASLEHEGLVDVKDYFEEGESQYLVMAFIDGASFEQLCPEGCNPPPVSQTIDWMIAAADVLTYLHEHDPPVIVRDLKPSNIMLDARGRLRLIDFGIARVYDSKSETVTFLKGAGTVGFAPLEQQGGGTTDPRSDIYALGATAYRLLTSVTPPSAVSLGSGEAALTPPTALNPKVAPEVEAVVLKMMALRKSDRQASAREAADDLRRVRSAVSTTGSARIEVRPRFCHQCGTTLLPGREICGQCGQALDPSLLLPGAAPAPSSVSAGAANAPSSVSAGAANASPQGGPTSAKPASPPWTPPPTQMSLASPPTPPALSAPVGPTSAPATTLNPLQKLALTGVALLLAFGAWYYTSHTADSKGAPIAVASASPTTAPELSYASATPSSAQPPTQTPTPSPTPTPASTPSPLIANTAEGWHEAPTIDGEWTGTLKGNDPEVDATFELRESDDEQVTGTFRWESSRTGACTRTLAGKYDPASNAYVLHDVSIADEQSTGGRFCKIGEYVLELDGSSLTGSYESQDCQDAGRVELTRSP